MRPRAFFPGRFLNKRWSFLLCAVLGLGLLLGLLLSLRVQDGSSLTSTNIPVIPPMVGPIWNPPLPEMNASVWRSVTGHRVPQEYVDDLPVCMAIAQGGIVGQKDEVAQLLGNKKRLSEEFYLSTTKDCKAYMDNRGFLTEPLSAKEGDFPIAYSMAIHADVEMFERLLRAVYNPQNVYCVHVDEKSTEGFQKAVRAIVSCLPNVFIASKQETVFYRTWSQVQAHLNCMKDLVQSPVQWRYLLNTCGADLPIKTNAEMVQALKLLNGKNNLQSHDMLEEYFKVRWQYHHKVTDTKNNNYIGTITRTGIRKTPPPIPMFSGSAYFVVTRDFVNHVLENKEIQNFMEWSRDTDCPDEHVWASLNRMSSVPGSVPAHSKYHRSDMNCSPGALGVPRDCR